MACVYLATCMCSCSSFVFRSIPCAVSRWGATLSVSKCLLLRPSTLSSSHCSTRVRCSAPSREWWGSFRGSSGCWC